MSNLGQMAWNIADGLRGPFKPNQYGDVILPFTVLRRLDCTLAPTRAQVRDIASKYEGKVLDVQVRKHTGLPFYNTSQFDFPRLLEDPDGLRANLVDYVNSFSENIDIFEKFEFEKTIDRLAEKGRLFYIVEAFARMDLHPSAVSNSKMGDLYEYVIRKFAEASNETAGEHFTPRDAIRLMVDLLFAEDTETLMEPGVVRSIYDPTAGTGGMLSMAESVLTSPGKNPQARLRLYGQEVNDQSYAICKADMISKGQDVDNIRLGDTLADDKFTGQTFDFCMSNPPYGMDWKASKEAIDKELKASHGKGRFGHGLPPINDGQMLFLSHLVHKMRPVQDGGGRAGIVMNASPLFNGAAGSGPSRIRQWLLEHDLVDAIVALPTDMFYNTGIATYIWILDNAKKLQRQRKVQLIDASDMGTRMKSLGSKRKRLNEAAREQIVALYDAYEDGEHSKILPNEAFGYWTITVATPLRANYSAARAATLDEKAVNKALGKMVAPAPYLKVLAEMGNEVHLSREDFLEAARTAFAAADLRLTPAQYRNLASALQAEDPEGEVVLDAKGKPVLGASEKETVPFTYAQNQNGEHGYERTVQAYMESKVLPYFPGAEVVHKETKVGYEVPFGRIFYTYDPPRPLAEIDAALEAQIAKILDMLKAVEA
ncbi:class I SAM-dependent DNA methyltransferase [Streptomyces sp. NPDC095614]|uniref:type I restriction-modification system subunit M n=1 Tax=Streptomyces sp. NPDC095614 TaxID=3156692 RepID=UPI0033200CA7